MKNLFDNKDTQETINRIQELSSNTTPLWGKMNVAQMLAHCNVAYEMEYEQDKFPKPNALMKFMLKTFVKSIVVGEKPYKKNQRTAPAFLIREKKDFKVEQNRLIEYLQKTQNLGAAHFDNKMSHSFGKLSASEWNVMFSKHLEHHLTQFGV